MTATRESALDRAKIGNHLFDMEYALALLNREARDIRDRLARIEEEKGTLERQRNALASELQSL